MPLPTIVFGIVLSSLYGALFHLWRGGSVKRLFLYLVLAWMGFWAGDASGWLLGWDLGAIGLLNAGMATVGSVLFLIVGDFLSHINISEE